MIFHLVNVLNKKMPEDIHVVSLHVMYIMGKPTCDV